MFISYRDVVWSEVDVYKTGNVFVYAVDVCVAKCTVRNHFCDRLKRRKLSLHELNWWWLYRMNVFVVRLQFDSSAHKKTRSATWVIRQCIGYVHRKIQTMKNCGERPLWCQLKNDLYAKHAFACQIFRYYGFKWKLSDNTTFGILMNALKINIQHVHLTVLFHSSLQQNIQLLPRAYIWLFIVLALLIGGQTLVPYQFFFSFHLFKWVFKASFSIQSSKYVVELTFCLWLFEILIILYCHIYMISTFRFVTLKAWNEHKKVEAFFSPSLFILIKGDPFLNFDRFTWNISQLHMFWHFILVKSSSTKCVVIIYLLFPK